MRIRFFFRSQIKVIDYIVIEEIENWEQINLDKKLYTDGKHHAIQQTVFVNFFEDFHNPFVCDLET